MARLSRGRDHALLGHDPRDPFAGASPYRHPDVDFSDVFGGPPRRSSIGRTGLGPGESAGGRGGGMGEDEAAAPRRAWSCSHGEVPVFGGAESPARRSRPEGGGFFDDIFRVSESGCSSPRKVDRDVFSSNSSSGVLSPARPLPPASDVFVRGSALPAQLRELKKDASGVQTQSGYGYFHFSMHKWASVGVTLVSPYNLRGRTKSGTKASGLSIQLPQSADSPTDKCMPQGHGNLHTQCDLEHKSKLSGTAAEETCTVNLMREVKEGFPASPDTDSVHSHTTDKSGDIETRSKDGAGVPVKAWKPEPKNLSQLLNNFSDKKGDKQRTGQTRNDESMVVDHNTNMYDVHGTANVEQTISENMFGSHTGKYTKKIHDTSAAGEDKIVGSRVKGKVKAFIKIFNQEPAPRSDENIENQARKPKTGNEARGRLDAYVANADEHEKEKLDNETLATSPLAANQNVEIGDIPASDRISCMQKMDYSSSEAKVVSPDQIPATLDASFLNIEEPYIENIDECLVEDNQNEVSQVTEADVYQDEIKKSDAKIREWSRGKEGNIRSLLSTLQYVLWPGSGWRPVPLVDIIEGASVRKAYQKALLCLHPDKLQQKGAEMHQKYIAEKVFDILQEAWIHFNSVSSL